MANVTTTTAYKKCEHGYRTTFAITHGADANGKEIVTRLIGCTGRHINHAAASSDVVLDLAGEYKAADAGWLKSGDSRVESLLTLASAPVHMRMQWTDHGTPPGWVNYDFWYSLYYGIGEWPGIIGKTVAIGCIGGHGRTGTAIGSIMAVVLDYTGEQVITKLRDSYCPNCIEGTAQEKYIHALAEQRARVTGASSG